MYLGKELSAWQKSFIVKYPKAKWIIDPYEIPDPNVHSIGIAHRLSLINSRKTDDYYFVVYYYEGEYSYFPNGYGKKKSININELSASEIDGVVRKHCYE